MRFEAPAAAAKRAVHVIFGTSNGLSTTNNQVLTRVAPTSQFGFALAVGDFNSDGLDDLANPTSALSTEKSLYKQWVKSFFVTIS